MLEGFQGANAGYLLRGSTLSILQTNLMLDRLPEALGILHSNISELLCTVSVSALQVLKGASSATLSPLT
jgi:hypothetical protein